MEVWQHYKLWNHVWNDAKPFKQPKYVMQEGLRHKATQGDYTRGMQYMAQMIEPIKDRAIIGQNKDQNMLRWELTSLATHANALAP